MKLAPRPYQKDAIAEIRRVWDQGVKNALLVLATGLGKTVVFSHLIREILGEHDQSAKAMVLAHRKELLDQARDKYVAVDPDEMVGIYRGEHRETWGRVICASVQSCYGDKFDKEGNLIRRGRVHELPLEDVKLLVVDEAHHTPAQSYLDFIEELRRRSPDCLVLGVTATPYRADGRGLGVLWDATLWDFDQGKHRNATGLLAYRMGIDEGIRQGFLAPFSPRSRHIVLQDVDMSGVKISTATKDYVEESLAKVLDTDDVRKTVVSKWLEHAGPGTEWAPADGRPTVVFVAGVEASKKMAHAFSESGIPADSIDGVMKKEHRALVTDRFQKGEIRVLCNCQVLTEGWDAPHTSCVMVVRPTRSLGNFIQMVGRGTRVMGADIRDSMSKGKADCLLLDFSGRAAQGIVGVEDLNRSDKAPGIDPTDEEEALESLMDAPPGELEQTLLEDVGLDIKRATIRGTVEYPIDFFGGGAVAWFPIGATRIVLIKLGVVCLVYREQDGTYTAIAVRELRQVRVIAEKAKELDALARASAFAMLHGDQSFIKPTGFYLRRPATDKQRAELHRLSASDPKAPIHLMPPIDKISLHQATCWISYLYVRRSWTKLSKVEDVYTPTERVDALEAARKRKARGG